MSDMNTYGVIVDCFGDRGEDTKEELIQEGVLGQDITVHKDINDGKQKIAELAQGEKNRVIVVLEGETMLEVRYKLDGRGDLSTMEDIEESLKGSSSQIGLIMDDSHTITNLSDSLYRNLGKYIDTNQHTFSRITKPEQFSLIIQLVMKSLDRNLKENS